MRLCKAHAGRVAGSVIHRLFTGTPIDKADANAQAVFGGYVSNYDIEAAKNDKATVAISYESRLAKLHIYREEIDELKKYSDRLIGALRKYHNRMIESSQVIAEMIDMAKDMQEAMKRHEALGPNPDEESFYDALADRPEVLPEHGRRHLEETRQRAHRKAAQQHDGGLAVP